MKPLLLASLLALSLPSAAFNCNDLAIFATMMTVHKHNGVPEKKLVDAVILIYGDDSDLTAVAKTVYSLPFEKKQPQEVYNFWADACMDHKIKEITKKMGV